MRRAAYKLRGGFVCELKLRAGPAGEPAGEAGVGLPFFVKVSSPYFKGEVGILHADSVAVFRRSGLPVGLCSTSRKGRSS